MEEVLGISERQIEMEAQNYLAIVGPTKSWWVDYLPEPYTLPMYDQSQSENSDSGLNLKMETALHKYPASMDAESGFSNVLEDKEEGEASLLLVFRDGLDQPIKNLEARIGTASSAVSQKTDDSGSIQVTLQGHTGKLPVTVKDHDGREQKVCDIDLSRCRQDAKIQSPKVVIAAQSRPHHISPPNGEGLTSANLPSPGNQPWYQANGALEKAKTWLADLLHLQTIPVDRAGKGQQPHVVAETATRSGHPSTVIVGPEVDLINNLRLGEDNVYRDIILRAAQRIKIVPHAICGLLECEAVRRIEKVYKKDTNGEIARYTKGNKKGQPILTHTIPHEWDARSYNNSTNAAGLSQFLPLTWLDCILKPGYFISDESVTQKKPWIAMDGGKRVFLASDGMKVRRNELPQFYAKNKTDPSVTSCLEMRFNPEWSIMAAVDYAMENWRALFSREGISDLEKLTDGEKAKIMYLLHHEGPGDGPKFICNTLVVGQKKFDDNVSSPAKWLKSADNSRSQAYQLFLADYIDRRIEFTKFAYNVDRVEKISPLLSIFPKIVK